MNISINIPDELAKQVQQYAVAHGTSVDALTTKYFSTLIKNDDAFEMSSDVELAHQQEVEKRLLALENGNSKAIPFEVFQQEMNERFKQTLAQRKAINVSA